MNYFWTMTFGLSVYFPCVLNLGIKYKSCCLVFLLTIFLFILNILFILIKKVFRQQFISYFMNRSMFKSILYTYTEFKGSTTQNKELLIL